MIYCCGCEKEVEARLTNGQEIYPHRVDLSDIPFWVCDGCQNYVGCHHKTDNRTQPLGCIPTEEIRSLRQSIHTAMDRLWKNGNISRSKLYREMSKEIGWRYHTAEVRSREQAGEVLRALIKIDDKLRRSV